MTPKQRFMRRLAGKPVDKIPNLCIVMLFAAYHAGIPYGEYCGDYKKLVEAQIRTAEDFGLDVLSTMSDPFRETSDYGAPVVLPPDDLPICKGPLAAGAEELHKIQPFNPRKPGGRMDDRVRAVELFKQLRGDEYPVLGWVEGAFAEFADLVTLSEALMMLVDEPEAVQETLARIARQQLACAKAQIDAGADVIGVGDAAAALISADMYGAFVLPLEKQLVSGIQAAGARVKLHICGNITHILPAVLSTGADIVDVDYPVDYARAVALAGGRCSLNGNFNPTAVLLQGAPQDVAAETRRCAAQGDAFSFVSAGCEVPKTTPPENFRAVHGVLAEWQQQEGGIGHG